MQSFSPLNQWLTLIRHSEDEAVILDAWHDASAHLQTEIVSLLAEGDTARLESLWQAVEQPEVAEFFDYLCSDTGPLHCSNKSDRVAGDSLHATLLRRLAGAGAAGALLSSSPQMLETWLPRCGIETVFPPSVFAATPETIVATLFDAPYAAASEEAANARRESADWLLRLLRLLRQDNGASGELLPPRPGAARRGPVLIHKGGRTGEVGWLTLQREDTQSGAVYADTEAMGLTPLSQAFRAAIVTAQSLARSFAPAAAPFPLPDVRWKLQSGVEAWEGRLLLEGGSHGAAFAVTLIQLMRDEPLDPKTALTMTIDAQGGFGPVTGVFAKVQAAFALRNSEGHAVIRRVVTHPDNENEARAAAAGAGRDPQTAILCCRSLAEFLPEASGLLGELRDFLSGEVKEILTDARRQTQRPFRDWAEFHRSCIPLRVWRAGAASQNALHSQTWDEAVVSARRAFVVGAPGSGKTILLWKEAGRRCLNALRQDAAQKATSPHQIEFACFLRAAEVAEALPASILEACPLLGAALSILGRRHRLSEEFATFLAAKLRDGSCLIALDGLDEAPLEHQAQIEEELRKALTTLPDARLLLSARRERALFAPRLFAQEDCWEVQALEPAQTALLIQRYFTALPSVGKAFHEQVMARPALRRVLASPLLLRIACSVTVRNWEEKQALPQWTRRAQLYEAFLQNLARAWSRREPCPTPAQQALFLDLAADAAWELLSQQMLAPTALMQSQVQSLNQVQQRYPMMAGRVALDDLCAAGILMYAGNDPLAPAIVFMHRTFGEYLAARSLMRRLESEGWTKHRTLINVLAAQSAWRETLLFLAGCLRDPLPLLELLADRSQDDRFRHRLALAAECLAEVPPEWLRDAQNAPQKPIVSGKQ